MNLLDRAAADSKKILTDREHGFGQTITMKDPDGKSGSLVGFAGEVASVIDPETNALVAGAVAHACVSISSLAELGFKVPTGTLDTTKRPWRVSFAGRDGVAKTYAVIRSLPDLTLGNVLLILTPHQS